MALINVTLKSFARFAVSQVTSRVEVVQAIKRMDGTYDPRKDFYKDLRDGIRKTLREGRPLSDLHATANSQAHSVKRNKFPPIVESWIDRWNEIGANYFRVPVCNWESGEVKVNIGADFGMSTPSGNYVVKMWFDSEPPSEDTVSIMLGVMHLSRNDGWQSDWHPAIWDAQRARIRTAPEAPFNEQVCQSVADSLQRMWEIN